MTLINFKIANAEERRIHMSNPSLEMILVMWSEYERHGFLGLKKRLVDKMALGNSTVWYSYPEGGRADREYEISTAAEKESWRR